MSHDPAIFGAPVAMNQPRSAGKHQFRCSVHRSPFEPTKRTCERSHFYRQHQRCVVYNRFRRGKQGGKVATKDACLQKFKDGFVFHTHILLGLEF